MSHSAYKFVSLLLFSTCIAQAIAYFQLRAAWNADIAQDTDVIAELMQEVAEQEDCARMGVRQGI